MKAIIKVYLYCHVAMLIFVNAALPRQLLGIDITLFSLGASWILDCVLVSTFFSYISKPINFSLNSALFYIHACLFITTGLG